MKMFTNNFNAAVITSLKFVIEVKNRWRIKTEFIFRNDFQGCIFFYIEWKRNICSESMYHFVPNRVLFPIWIAH